MKRKKTHSPLTLGIFFLSFALLFGACQSISTQVSVPPQTAEPTMAQQQVSPSPTLSGELTYEEMRSTTPPAPLDFRLTAQGDSIRLDWSLPPSVEIPHQYSDVIIHYNVYRRTGDQAGTQVIATTENLFYVDESGVKGVTYYYSVSAVHEGPLEGERTDEISATLP